MLSTPNLHRTRPGYAAAIWPLLLVLPLGACSSDAAKRAAYESAYQKSCIDRGGQMNCDPDHKSYDEYREQRKHPEQAQPPGR